MSRVPHIHSYICTVPGVLSVTLLRSIYDFTVLPREASNHITKTSKFIIPYFYSKRVFYYSGNLPYKRYHTRKLAKQSCLSGSGSDLFDKKIFILFANFFLNVPIRLWLHTFFRRKSLKCFKSLAAVPLCTLKICLGIKFAWFKDYDPDTELPEK